jgi:hypothetical protein
MSAFPFLAETCTPNPQSIGRNGEPVLGSREAALFGHKTALPACYRRRRHHRRHERLGIFQLRLSIRRVFASVELH